MRCVIVDDNEPFLSEARELLTREGIDVVGVATTSADAIETIALFQPEVTLVDIDLGRESGFDLVQALVAGPTTSPTIVILISAYAELDFVDLIESSPAVGFVSKPQLSARTIQDVLGKHANSILDERLRRRSET